MKAFTFLLFLVLIITACEKEEVSDSPGLISGYLSYDLLYYPLDSAKLITSGVVVKLTGKYHSYSVGSNKKGYYEINHVDSDTYILSFESAKYAQYKLYFRHNGIERRKIRDQRLAELPKGQIKSTGVPFLQVIENPEIYQRPGNNIFLPVEVINEASNYRVFVGNDKDVSPENYLYTDIGVLVSYKSQQRVVTIPVQDLLNAGFKEKTTVHIKAYVADLTTIDFGYRIPGNSKFSYSAVNPVSSKVVSFTLP
jgi:hypothetical protein